MNASVHFCSFDRHFQILNLYRSASREQCFDFSFWLFTFNFYSLSLFTFIHEFVLCGFTFSHFFLLFHSHFSICSGQLGQKRQDYIFTLPTKATHCLNTIYPLCPSNHHHSLLQRKKNNNQCKEEQQTPPWYVIVQHPQGVRRLVLVRRWKHYFADLIAQNEHFPFPIWSRKKSALCFLFEILKNLMIPRGSDLQCN